MSIEEKYYGKGGRLSMDANKKLINTAYTHDAMDSPELIEGLHIADIVHVLALFKAKSLPKEETLILLKALIEISTENIEINPELGDVYNSKEFALKQKIKETAGWLHMGRARREAINNGFLINFKKHFLDFQDTATNLCATMSNLSNNNLDTIMSDFTYMLHAQPTTLGHYLGTYITPLSRDLERLENYYERLDQSWAGIGSVNGSRLPIDRTYLSHLLSCNKPAIHIRDAMWMPDILNEGMFLLANIIGNLNRFVEELIVWNTIEFSYLEIDDSYARSSVIMPQKKNPYPLAYLRGLCNEVTGKVTTYLMIGKEPSGFPDNRIFIYGDIIRTYAKVNNALDMFGDFLNTIKWNKDKMEQTAIKSFGFATDLAEEITILTKIDYKNSHKIVGKSIKNKIIDESQDIMVLVADEIKKQNVILSEKELLILKNTLEIKFLVNNRKSIGAASTKSMKLFLNEIKEIIEDQKRKIKHNKLSFNNINDNINNEIQKISYELPIFKSTIQTN